MSYSTAAMAAESPKKKSIRSSRSASVAAQNKQKELAATRARLIERMKASRQNLRDSLSRHEKELQDQVADYEAKQKLYAEDAVSRQEVEESAQRVADTRQTMEQIQQWITEDDVALALTPEAAEEESERLPALPAGGYSETASYILYNGAGRWSLSGVRQIAKFFRAQFGRALPISALGQSSTHDRMSLDHRNAVDISVAPDSQEGRSLIAYLRRNRIPFIAFRRKIPSMSTGPHIHVGPPSPPLIEVKRRTILTATPEQSAEGG